jgi:hypothetical protein
MDPYSTHIPLLSSVIAGSPGPILELGMGYYSTHLLNLFSKIHRVKVVSVETNADWYSKFQHLGHEFHELRLVNSYDELDLETTRWDVTFIDHEPDRRIVEVKRLVSNSSLLVLHDTETPAYRYDFIWGLFKFHYTVRTLYPWTTVIGNDEVRWKKLFGEYADNFKG